MARLRRIGPVDKSRSTGRTGRGWAGRAAALAAIAFLLGSSAPGATAPPAVAAPNIIIIVVDDLGWPDVSVYGRSTVPTPNLYRLGRSGVAFTNGYAAASVCSLSRAAILTGKMPQSYGLTYNIDESGQQDQGLPLDQTTMADRLHARGYRTGAIGKWHQGASPRYYPMRRGFDYFYGFLSGEALYADPGTPGIVTTPAKSDKPMARKPVWNTVTGPDATIVPNHSRYLTDDFTEHAVDFIGESAGKHKPYFLYLAYNAPHWPLQVTRQWYDRFPEIKDPIRRTYVAMIASMDAGVGRVLDALDRSGKRDNTLIVFMSDNGCPAQFGACDCSHPFGAGKFTYIEGGTRVPFIVSWPKRLKARGLMATPVSALDILPTALGASGGGVPAGLAGRDLIAAARGDRGMADRTLVWGQDPVFAARRGAWKLWQSRDRGETHLYDLTADPGELTDLSQRNPAVARRLGKKIDDWRASLPAPLWPRRAAVAAKMCAKSTELVY